MLGHVSGELIWALPVGFAVLDWYAVARADRRTESWAQPATHVALVVTAVVLGAADCTTGRWLLVALVFGRTAPPQASMTTGMIMGLRRCVLFTQRPTTRRTVC